MPVDASGVYHSVSVRSPRSITMPYGSLIRQSNPFGKLRSRAGIVLLVLTKSSDLLTTAVGLTVVDGVYERNPVAAWVYSDFGLLGLAVLSLLGILLILLVVESASRWVANIDDCQIRRSHLTLISYLPLSVVFAFATVHNSILLLQIGG